MARPRRAADHRRASDPKGRAPGITALHLQLDGAHDREFWDEWAADWRFGTPVYYGPHLVRFPERNLAVLEAIATAQPGRVLFHCMGGRDRTGMVAMLVLTLVGVAPEDIADDYELSATDPVIAAAVEAAGTTTRAELLRTLAELDLVPFEALRLPLRARLLGDHP